MAVTILRKTGWLAPWGKLSLQVQEEEIGKIANNQNLSFDLPHYPVHLSVKGDPKSAILVSDHQKYILCSHPYFQHCYLTAFTFFAFSFTIQNNFLKWIFWLICFCLVIGANLFLPRYSFKALIGPKIKIKEFC